MVISFLFYVRKVQKLVTFLSHFTFINIYFLLIFSLLWRFFKSIINIPFLSFYALKAWYFWFITQLSTVFLHLFNLYVVRMFLFCRLSQLLFIQFSLPICRAFHHTSATVFPILVMLYALRTICAKPSHHMCGALVR